MENAVKVFKSAEFGDVRTMGTSENPLFCLADLCQAIGVNNNREAAKRLDADDVSFSDTVDTLGRKNTLAYVTEAGMYTLLLRSNSAKAKPFRKWVTGEVLPSIRKSGGYLATREGETNEQFFARAVMLAQQTLDRQTKEIEAHKQLEAAMQDKMHAMQKKMDTQADIIRTGNEIAEKQQRIIEVMEPSYNFAKAVETSKQSILVGEMARILKANGVDTGQTRFFQWLRDNGYLIRKQGESYNQPTQRSMDLGLFEIKKTVITKPDGTSLVTTTPKITGKGQVYFINKLTKTA